MIPSDILIVIVTLRWPLKSTDVFTIPSVYFVFYNNSGRGNDFKKTHTLKDWYLSNSIVNVKRSLIRLFFAQNLKLYFKALVKIIRKKLIWSLRIVRATDDHHCYMEACVPICSLKKRPAICETFNIKNGSPRSTQYERITLWRRSEPSEADL